MTTHGLSTHPLYRKWKDIKKRCCNKNCPAYHDYGARGISLCDEWINNPKGFIEYVDQHLGPCPNGYSLDRIDNDGHYEPGNIRWATRQQQNVNKRHPNTHNTRVGKSGYKWVMKSGNNFMGRYTHQNIVHLVGYYTSALDAHNAVLAHRQEHGFSV